MYCQYVSSVGGRPFYNRLPLPSRHVYKPRVLPQFFEHSMEMVFHAHSLVDGSSRSQHFHPGGWYGLPQQVPPRGKSKYHPTSSRNYQLWNTPESRYARDSLHVTSTQSSEGRASWTMGIWSYRWFFQLYGTTLGPDALLPLLSGFCTEGSEGRPTEATYQCCLASSARAVRATATGCPFTTAVWRPHRGQ